LQLSPADLRSLPYSIRAEILEQQISIDRLA
jgi:hypothetical protein